VGADGSASLPNIPNATPPPVKLAGASESRAQVVIMKAYRDAKIDETVLNSVLRISAAKR
jgi:hypothetical protein